MKISKHIIDNVNVQRTDLHCLTLHNCIVQDGTNLSDEVPLIIVLEM